MRELLARYGLTLPAEDYPPLPLVLDEEVLEAQPDQVSLTARFVDEAVRFVRQQRHRPWFLYLAHIDMRLELGDGRLGVVGPGVRPVGEVEDPTTLTAFDPEHPYYMAEYDLTGRG